MEKIRWEKRYETGIERIDKQHRKLVELTSELVEATESGKARRIIVDVLKSLIYYTKTHFVDEEKIMQEVGFPEYEAHKEEHEEFIKRVHESTIDLIQGHSVPSIKLTEFLFSWLVDHILIHDKKIGNYIKQRLKESL
ncbi:MAG: hemerythrin family protein [Leptospiraceae bacterium]|nr:hemerythrin family protein [Leptospiraceae bacterium]